MNCIEIQNFDDVMSDPHPPFPTITLPDYPPPPLPPLVSFIHNVYMYTYKAAMHRWDILIFNPLIYYHPGCKHEHLFQLVRQFKFPLTFTRIRDQGPVGLYDL